jgi:ACT domain-containing protein
MTLKVKKVEKSQKYLDRKKRPDIMDSAEISQSAFEKYKEEEE